MAELTSVGLLEMTSIALGNVAEDAMLKAAPVELLLARTVCSGKFLIVVGGHLAALVFDEQVQRATLWPTAGLEALGVRAELERSGVCVVDPSADKHELGRCDLGITEVDVAPPETGTLGLFSSSTKPRAVSLLPRVHLAILTPQALVADLHDAFSRARHEHYLVFVTGPSRAADIELTVTLGVHGPRRLVLWCVLAP